MLYAVYYVFLALAISAKALPSVITQPSLAQTERHTNDLLRSRDIKDSVHGVPDSMPWHVTSGVGRDPSKGRRYLELATAGSAMPAPPPSKRQIRNADYSTTSSPPNSQLSSPDSSPSSSVAPPSSSPVSPNDSSSSEISKSRREVRYQEPKSFWFARTKSGVSRKGGLKGTKALFKWYGGQRFQRFRRV